MSEPANRLTRASEPSESHAAQSESKADTACDSLLDTVKSTVDPFKQTFSLDGSALHHVSEAVNALASLQSAPSQLLNTGIAQIPLLDKMPGMPAATIGVPHLGTPHAHSHPPSSGFPLPSIGATIGSGCLSVLIGGIPAARVLDIGIAPTCGGLTPYFDIQTGSSNTFFGGMRAARMGIDMTRHCNPMGHAGKSGEEAGSAAEKGEQAASEAAEVSSRARWMGRAGKAWKVGNAAVGPASGAAGAAADAAHGEELAAAMMAAQTAADAAMMLLGNLMGKDPGIEPSMGMLLAGNPTVLVGGFPMPDAMAAAMAGWGLRKKVNPGKGRARTQHHECDGRGEPINPVTGDVENRFMDYETNEIAPFEWGRHYSSAWHERDGLLGCGFRHTFQHELRLLRTRAIYTDPQGREFEFDKNADGSYAGCCDGYELEQHDANQFVLWHGAHGHLFFERSREATSLARFVFHDRNGVRTTFRRNIAGDIEWIAQADENGNVRRTIGFQYDLRGRIIEVLLTAPDGQTIRIAHYEYDTEGCLVEHQDAMGATSTYAYDSGHRVIRLTDPSGYSFFYQYDSEGRCVESTGQDGMWRVAFQYHPRRTIVTEGDGGKWTVLYNEAGTITRIIDPYGGAEERVTGSDGRVIEEVDSSGRVLRWLYDERDRNTARIDRWGNGWPTKDEAPVLPNPFAHPEPGSPLDLQWGKGGRTRLADTVLLPPEIARIAATIFAPDAPASSPSEQRDAAGRVIARTDEHGRIERLTYDGAGNLLQRRDKDGRDYYYSVTSWNLRERETDPLGNTVRYRYTPKRRIAAIVDANGNESAYTYDFKDRVTSVRRHGVLRETYAYDAGDRVIEKRDGAGNVLLQFEVGDDGLYSKRICASGEVHTYAYDARANLIKASTDEFDVSMSRDALNRRTVDKRDGRGVEHAYAGGQLARTTYLDRFEVHYEAMGDGEVRIHPPAGGSHKVHRTCDGQILLCLGNGTNALYGFDKAGRCGGRIVWTGGGAMDIGWVQYQYSATDELRRVIDSAKGMTEYQYDAAHRPIEETRDGWRVRRYEYDPGGNLLSTPACEWMRYGEGNRLATSSFGTFRYNDRNHLCEELGGNARTAWHYNSLDLLVKVSWSDRNEVWTAKYDGLCRRVSKTMGDEHTEYYWDGDRVAAEIAPNGELRVYVYVNEIALLPFMFIDYPGVHASPAAGRAYFVFCNQAGLPEWIEDSDRRVVWRAQAIDAYGAVQVEAGNALEYDLRWPGHWLEREIGLHYNRFRSYSPDLGRYLQSDPNGQAGGVNLYAYVPNPLVSVDLRGLHSNKQAAASSEDGAQHPDLGPSKEQAKEGHSNVPHKRPTLTAEQGNEIVADIHRAGWDYYHSGKGTNPDGRNVTALTELEDGRIAITSNGTLSPAQVAVAFDRLGNHGFDMDKDVIIPGNRKKSPLGYGGGDTYAFTPKNKGETETRTRPYTGLGYDSPNPNYKPGSGNLEPEHFAPDRPAHEGHHHDDKVPGSACNHAEARGIQRGIDEDSRAVRQWTYSDANHQGYACHDCHRLQEYHKVKNETGVQ
ncbi:hypothetical protein WJ32_26295 [Burkholderia ubonensis]|uniref:Type IV secretion protein Rhs n=1 Tax=Burkholderia ubonensis TaxID=101571 RepID=A0A118HJH2_9BURK|nr:RHS repeat-associated core domain-containing protein [Burkholderia ubonensis]AOJ65929.1 hypothetical protein WJ32_26295 [Burkholderia ubonensis]KVG53101.1 hypothetical protein WJ33_08225 [Burkholderia ubonensis]